MKTAYAFALVATLTATCAYANDNAQKIAVVKKVVDYGDVSDFVEQQQGRYPSSRFYPWAVRDLSDTNWVAPLASKGLKASIKKQHKFEQDVERGLIKNYTESAYDTTVCEFSDAIFPGHDYGVPLPTYQFKVLKNGNVEVVESTLYDGNAESYGILEFRLVKENGTYKIDDVFSGFLAEMSLDNAKSYKQAVNYYCRPGKYKSQW